ncbi:MAG: insulinase family protein [Candidatus Eisenbacteria sp.]|nr:insulinase family protein [Candidatus Eisenbacteria bacterium]
MRRTGGFRRGRLLNLGGLINRHRHVTGHAARGSWLLVAVLTLCAQGWMEAAATPAGMPGGMPGKMPPGMPGGMPGKMPPGMRGVDGDAPVDSLAMALQAGLVSSLVAEARQSGERLWLGNGIPVYLFPDATSRMVTSIVVVSSGSAYESARLAGASHFLEHMLFNGTTSRSQKQLYDETDLYGGFNNAFTRRSHTAFMMAMPSAYLGNALDLQSDMLFHSTFAPQKFEKERGIILEELAKDRDSQHYALERLLQAETYPESSYGRAVLGTEGSIAALERDEVYAFYQRAYVPERMQILLLGGFETSAAIDSLEHYFGRVRPSGASWHPPQAPAAPVVAETRLHALPLSHSRLRMVWDAPAPTEAGALAAEAAIDLYLGDLGSPVAQALQQRIPEGILGWQGYLESGPGFGRLLIDIELAPHLSLRDLRAAVDAALGEIEPLPEARLAAWRISERAALRYGRERSYMFAPLVSERVSLEGVAGLQSYPQRIGHLGSAETFGMLRTVLPGPVLTIGVQAIREGSLAEREVHRIPKSLPSSDIEVTDDSAYEDMSVIPYSIVDTTLANHSRVLLLQAPANGVLAIYVLIDGRNYLEPEGEEGITELLHTLMGTATERLDEAALTQALDAIGAQLQTADRPFLPFDDRYTRADFSFIRFQALEEHAHEALVLLAEMLQTPRLDPELIERARAQMLARLQREASQAGTHAREHLAGVLFGQGHPEARSPYGLPAGLARIGVDELEAYHRRLLDPRRIWVGVVSSLPPGDILGPLADLLPPLAPEPSATLGFTPERYPLWMERAEIGARAAARLSAAAGQVDLSGGGARGYVLEAVSMPGEDSGTQGDDAGALRIATALLSSHLAFDLREERGMAYGIGAGLRRVGNRWIYLAGAGTRRENIDAMAEGFGAGRRQASSLAGAEAVRREANALYGRMVRRQETRLNQAMASIWAVRDGRPPLAWWREAEMLPSVPPERVQRALVRLAESPAALLITVE